VTILSFADTRFPIERANGVQTMHTCHALAVRGHALTLLVRPDTTVPARDPFAFYGLPHTSRLTIEPITTSGAAPLRRAQMLWTGVRRALSNGVDVVFTRDLGLAALLARLPAGRRPALVYESHGIAPIVAGEMPRLLGKPDQVPSPAKIRRLDRREWLVWRTADAYVTITQALATDLADRYGHRDAVFVVPDGASPATGEPREPAAGAVCAAYAGHLYPWKGIDIFLQALAQTRDIRGLIVGGHPGEADLGRITRLIIDLHLSDRVRITGMLAPHAVAAALDEADVLVLPNTHSAISDRYTSPLKLFEYLTRGKAIVASDLPSLREVLTDDTSALLVPAGDAGALATALERLQADPALRLRLGAAARALAPDYTWDRRAERLDAALTAAVRA